MENCFEEMTDYCEKNGIKFTVDTDPSPEKVARIKASIKRKEELREFFIKRYKEEN